MVDLPPDPAVIRRVDASFLCVLHQVYAAVIPSSLRDRHDLPSVLCVVPSYTSFHT